MNEEIILVAETGSDLTPQQAQENLASIEEAIHALGTV